MTKFIDRVKFGKEAEAKVYAFLKANGIEYKLTGQENWMPKWVHNKLRYTHDDQVFDIVRHFPDIATRKMLIQVKCAPKSNDYPSVTLEQASYNASSLFHKYEIPVLFVWLMQDRSLKANWVSELSPEYSNTPRQEANGSHTPMFIIRKHNLFPIESFFDKMWGTNGN